MKFIHTADWQLGKPFAGIADSDKRAKVKQARFEAVRGIGKLVKEHEAEFVLVAGDLFDSPTADKSTVSESCGAIGEIGVPVYVIPGNHDHGGTGSLWEQKFYLREQSTLAPNMKVLLRTEPIETDSAVILPCPLLRRTLTTDPLEWLRSNDVYAGLTSPKPRIVLAHGSTQGFSGQGDDEDEEASISGTLDLSRLPEAEIDYIALGDWHGTKQIAGKAWYSGTPEYDRFPKSEEHDQGNILVVEAGRGILSQVNKIPTATLMWNDILFDFSDDTSLTGLENELKARIQQRTGQDLLRLSLSGSVGIGTAAELEQLLDSLRARLLRLKLIDLTRIAPTEQEIQDLTQRAGDPLISSVAGILVEKAGGEDEDAQIARIALRELYAVSLEGRQS